MASYFGPRRDSVGCLCQSLALIVALCLASEVDALDKFWDGGAAPAGLDGVFSVGANWNTTLPPDATDVAHFGVSSPPSPFQFIYTVTFSANANTSSLLIEDDFVTFDLNAHTYTNNHSPFLVAIVGYLQHGLGRSVAVYRLPRCRNTASPSTDDSGTDTHWNQWH